MTVSVSAVERYYYNNHTVTW